jgi:protocatechuate 3,4-dioxygenase beta subunit
MRAGSPPVLEFNREGFEETRQRIEAALDPNRSEVQLDVQMKSDEDLPKVAVAGQVLGPLGEAVAGVSVRLKSFHADQGYSDRTDDSGEFNIPMVEAGEGYRLNVLPNEDYEAYQSEVFSLGPQDAFLEIELDAAKFSSLSGTVTDLTGRPLSGFQLWLRGIGTSAQSPLSVRTDAAGRFQLEKLRAGEVRLESRSQPMLSASKIILEPGVQKEVEIPLDWGTDWLLGRVVDSQGKPVSGASIIVKWKEMFGSVLSESRRDLRSDLEGYFTVSNLGAENYSLTVQVPGYQTIQGQHQMGGSEEEMLIQLPPIGASGGAGGGSG